MLRHLNGHSPAFFFLSFEMRDCRTRQNRKAPMGNPMGSNDFMDTQTLGRRPLLTHRVHQKLDTH